MNTPLRKNKKLSKRKLDVIRDNMTVAHTSFESSLSKRALYKTNDVEVGHDLVQTTFLKTLLYLQRGGQIDVMRSFLNHILNDLIVDEYRKKKMTSLDVLLEKGFDPGYDDQDRVTDIFDGREVVLLIPLLPPKYRSVMRQRFLQSLSLKEISVLTGQSQNTVAVQVHRGVARLKKLYTESHRHAAR